MEFEDFLEPEVGIAAAVVAAIASPRVRKLLRRGAVYGVAGVLMAGDAVTSLAKGVRDGAQNVAVQAAQRNQQTQHPGQSERNGKVHATSRDTERHDTKESDAENIESEG